MEYAESAMNEFLGWYGYCSSANNNDDDNNRTTIEQQQFNSMPNNKMRTPEFTTISSTSTTTMTTTTSTAAVAAVVMTISSPSDANSKRNAREDSLSLDDTTTTTTTDSMSAIDEMATISSPLQTCKEPSPPLSSSSSAAAAAATNSLDRQSLSPVSHPDECGWCKRIIPFGGTSEFSSATPDGLKYCSESCFMQSRRASYKRAKTCDWCKHIRHAVSYVDFNDGATQLQFCSDKCLNQYKMQIFCKETQAHLDLNPHLKDAASKTSHDKLITPDLWMRNCQSRSITPPDDDGDDDDNDSPESSIVSAAANEISTIKVTSVSKLLHSACDSKATTAKSQRSESKSVSEPKDYSPMTGQKSKTLRKRRANRLNSNTSLSGMVVAAAAARTDSGNLSEGSNNSSNENRKSYTKRMRSVAKNTMNGTEWQHQKQQQLRRNHLMPSLSSSGTINEHQQSQNAALIHRYQMIAKQQQHTPNSSIFRMDHANRSLQTALRQSAQFVAPIPNHAFADATTATNTTGRSPKISPQHSPYGKRTTAAWQCSEPVAPAMHPSQRKIYDGENQRLFAMHQPPLPPPPPSSQLHHQQQQQHQHKLMALNEFVTNLFGTVTPPSTLLIPYPIVLPLPLPIPIPLPYEAFLTRLNKNVNSQNGTGVASKNNNVNEINNQTYRRENDQPLDFTKGATKISNHIYHRRRSDEDENDAGDDDFVDWDEFNSRRPTLRSTLKSLDATGKDQNSMHRKNESSSNAIETVKSKTSTSSPVSVAASIHRQHMNNNNHNNNRLRSKEMACENNRPLRKRKRIIDCDYLRLRENSNATSSAAAAAATTSVITNTPHESINPRKSI